MENYEIYDDLAPFNGDLFKLDAPVEFEPFGIESNYNGLDSFLKSSQAVATTLLDECGSPPASPIDSAIGGPYDQPWLDTHINIQEILQCNVDTGSKIDADFQVLHIPEQQATECSSFAAPESEQQAEFQVVHIPEEICINELQNNTSDSFTFSFGNETSINTSVESMSFSNDVELSDLVPLMADTIDDLELEHYMSSETVLSPMSPEDIESILSVSPSPPDNPIEIKQSSQIITIDLSQLHPSITSELEKCLLGSGSIRDDQESDNTFKISSSSNTSVRQSPYETPKRKGGRSTRTTEKKSRKMKQNKEAALRYRQKKKGEQETLDEECERLEARNQNLHDSVDSLAREIQYLKGLMSDVYKAKGLKLATKGIKKSK